MKNKKTKPKNKKLYTKVNSWHDFLSLLTLYKHVSHKNKTKQNTLYKHYFIRQFVFISVKYEVII